MHIFVTFHAKFFEQVLCAGENSSEISGVEVKKSVSRSLLTQSSTSVANKRIFHVRKERLYEEAGFVFLAFSPVTHVKTEDLKGIKRLHINRSGSKLI